MPPQSHTKNPRIRKGTTRGAASGFTMLEILIGVVLVGLTALVAVKFFLTVKGQLPERSVSIGADVLRVAPSEAAFVDASRVHGLLVERLNEAKAVYVLGGSHEGIAPTATRASQKPLQASALPAISDFSGGLPLDAFGFYSLYSAQLGPTEVSPDPSDFSLIVIGQRNGALAVIALVQARTASVSVSDGSEAESFVRRTVNYFDVDGNASAYSFLERPSVASAITVGARHYWYRYAEGLVADEGPTSVVFPDPWIYGGSRGVAGFQAPPFSQFTYLTEVSP